MKLLQVSIASLILRFYLIMGIVIGAFFIDQAWLSFLALPVFIVTLLGIRFQFRKVPKRSPKPATSALRQHQPVH